MRRFAPFLAVLLAGCSMGEVSASDDARMKAEFSPANYEKAMRAAGKGKELEVEKEAAARRGE